MGTDLRKGSHTVNRLTCHVVWVANRFEVLKGDIQKRFRVLLIQICEAERIDILKGIVSSDHVHKHIEYASKQNVISILKSLKGRTSRKLHIEFPKLQARYCGQHFWASGYGGSAGNITDEMVNEYLQHHRKKMMMIIQISFLNEKK